MRTSQQTEKKIRVIVADDHPIFREGIVRILNDQPDVTVIGQYDNGADAVQGARNLSPDVAILDLRMPGMSGADAASAILDDHPKCGILILTTYGGGGDIQRAMRAGVRGYVLKESRKHEVLHAVREVAKGRLYLSRDVGINFAHVASMPALTRREREILRLISTGITNKEVATELGITEGTVKTHVNGILQKMNVGSRTEAAFMAVELGLLLD